jgi:hypothetical protein
MLLACIPFYKNHKLKNHEIVINNGLINIWSVFSK